MFVGLAILASAFAVSGESTDTPDWCSTVSEPTTYVAKAEEGNAVLRVEMEKPAQERLQEVRDSEGAVTGYLLDGKKLPERFWPGCTVLKKFDLEWEGRKIEIPRRFWADLTGFRIQESPLSTAALPAEKRFEGERFLASLDKSRVYISADGGTLLIEWARPEECDGRSTIRWIISRSGVILRHRHTPPHEC